MKLKVLVFYSVKTGCTEEKAGFELVSFLALTDEVGPSPLVTLGGNSREPYAPTPRQRRNVHPLFTTQLGACTLRATVAAFYGISHSQ